MHDLKYQFLEEKKNSNAYVFDQEINIKWAFRNC